jgi:hypothetical protein
MLHVAEVLHQTVTAGMHSYVRVRARTRARVCAACCPYTGVGGEQANVYSQAQQTAP